MKPLLAFLLIAGITPAHGQTVHRPQRHITAPAINPVHLNGQQRFNEMKARLTMPTHQLRQQQMQRARQLVRPMQGTICVKRVDGTNAQCITFDQ